MENFIAEQGDGKLVDKDNAFTLDRARSRDKLLQSIPTGSIEPAHRLLMAVANTGEIGEKARLGITHGGQNSSPGSYLELPQAGPDFVAELLEELRKPFGADTAASRLAKALYRAAHNGAHVSVKWSRSGLLLLDNPQIVLQKGKLDIATDLQLPNGPGLSFWLFPPDFAQVRDFFDSPPSKLSKFQNMFERAMPLESFATKTSGFFDYRTKPFTAIRSYAFLERDNEAGFGLDLWEGPYTRLDDRTVILNKKEPAKFWFLRWRAGYGNPTFIHHALDSELQFTKRRYGATFWVSTDERSAHVYLYSGGVFADPIDVRGPLGLTGVVTWPGLKYDLWGTSLVQNEEYQRALKWTQEKVDETAQCLSENLDKVEERLRSASLIKSSYVDETIARIRSLWGDSSP